VGDAALIPEEKMESHSLELDDIQSRLRFDFQVVSLMSNPLMEVQAFRDVDDLRALRDPITSVDDGHLATHYHVDYNLRTLISRDQYSPRTTVHFDLFANNNYPLTEPSCFVIDTPMPWSPHFWAGYPICIGDIWEQSEGTMLLGQLFIHIAKLLNFDEPAHTPGYEGYNGEAIEYWETVLGRQPITPSLIYPRLPDLVYAPLPAPKPARPLFARKSVIGAAPKLISRRVTPAAIETSAKIKIRRSQ
jgi:hypothetical protein